MNTVHKLVFGEPPNQEIRIWKKEPEKEAFDTNSAKNIGIDPNDPRFGKRNIATKMAADALGLGRLAPEVHFVPYEGKLGLAMSKAPGSPKAGSGYERATDPNMIGFVRSMPEHWREQNGWVQVGEDWWRADQAVYFQQPLEDPPSVDLSYMKEMVNLQWLDAFCGQVDRHGANYLVEIGDDNQAHIVAIDNDFCFGDKHTQVGSYQRGEETVETAQEQGFWLPKALPPVIDRAVYQRLEALTFEEFTGGMGDLLTDSELAAARGRFDQLKEHAGALHPLFVIADWAHHVVEGHDSLKAYLLSGAAGDTYYKRDLMANRDADPQPTP